MLFAEHLSESYTQVLSAAQSLQLPLEQVESRLLRITYAEAMDLVLRRWSFPRGLINPIVHHHAEPADVKSLAPHQSIDVLRLGLADRLAHAMMLGSSGNDTIYPTEEHCRQPGCWGDFFPIQTVHMPKSLTAADPPDAARSFKAICTIRDISL